jgi:N-formylglutamate amidohydrolase
MKRQEATTTDNWTANVDEIFRKHGLTRNPCYDRAGQSIVLIPRRLKKSKSGSCFRNILLHIPHSSTSFPEESGYTFEDLNADEQLLIDYYTDELFLPEQPSAKIDSVVFPYCRLYCDVERLINDPLEKEGLGISYRRRTDNPAQQPSSFSTLQSAFPLYADHHSLVAKKLVSMGDGTLLIDCHSFSSIPNMLNSNPPDIDICIGYNDDETRPDNAVLGVIVRHFTSLGYKVGINTPFSNSKTFSVPVKYSSVMIEVNKRLYMDERTLGKTEGFDKLKREILELYDLL